MAANSMGLVAGTRPCHRMRTKVRGGELQDLKGCKEAQGHAQTSARQVYAVQPDL